MTETLSQVTRGEYRNSPQMVNNPNSTMDNIVYKDFDKLPKQLKNPEYRFILVLPWQKIPAEKEWAVTELEKTKAYKDYLAYEEEECYAIKPKLHNYQYNDQYFNQKLENGYNYGVICNEVSVFDCDNVERLNELGILDKLPKTFTVKTQSGGLHKYLNVIGIKNKIILLDRGFLFT